MIKGDVVGADNLLPLLLAAWGLLITMGAFACFVRALKVTTATLPLPLIPFGLNRDA